ncbi:MAG: RDD family protein [Elusimicrobiaceae bacterium]|nr:RDD family protein [Elusimicrobiaceae bacterium]
MNNIYPYAGFWKRAAAWFIDSLILYMATVLTRPILAPLLINPELAQKLQQVRDHSAPLDPHIFMSLVPAGIILLLISVALPWLYFALMESSSKQATLGKMAVGIKVVGLDGNRISFGRALGRTVAKIVSRLILTIGFYMAGATRKKQALHDKMADTYVVEKNFQPGDELPDVETHFGILTTVIVAEVLCLVAVLGLFVGLVALAIRAAQESNTQTPAPTVQVQQTVNR